MGRGGDMMPPDEEQALYDARIVLTFPAEDENHAIDLLDNLLDYLEDEGYELGPATIEKSTNLETT